MGNEAFPEAVIIGHDRVRELLDRDGDEIWPTSTGPDGARRDPRSACRDADRATTVITTGQLSVDLGTRRVRVTYHGRGHTGSDAVDVGFVRSQRADIAVAIERSRRTDRRRAVAA